MSEWTDHSKQTVKTIANRISYSTHIVKSCNHKRTVTQLTSWLQSFSQGRSHLKKSPRPWFFATNQEGGSKRKCQIAEIVKNERFCAKNCWIFINWNYQKSYKKIRHFSLFERFVFEFPPSGNFWTSLSTRREDADFFSECVRPNTYFYQRSQYLNTQQRLLLNMNVHSLVLEIA